MDTKPLDNKLLLLNSITLLFREAQLQGVTERSSQLVRNVMALIRLPTNVSQLTLDPTSQILDGLKRFTLNMADDSTQEFEDEEILSQIKLLCLDDLNLFESFERAISVELKESSLKKTTLNLRRSLMNHLRNEGVKAEIHRANVQIQFRSDEITNMQKFVAEHIATLEPYLQDAVTNDPAIVAQVQFSNLESIAKIYKDVQNDASGSSVIRSGWQGINRMTRGGFRRGEQWVVPALPHMNKSGFVLDLFRQFSMYNVPLMLDQAKKPLHVFFSFENAIEQNMQYIYSKLKANLERVAIPAEELAKLPPEEVSTYVYEKMRVNGYEAMMLRIDPTKWTYLDLCNKLMELDADGYEIHTCIADYLYMIPTTGCSQGPAGHDVRDLFRRVRNFISARKITFITPHQISTDGKQLIRDGRTDFVKELPGKGYFAGSRQIDQEVDGEIYLHIEKANGRAYQTYQRGKHRIVGQTPILDQYCVHEFDPALGILDDVLGADTTRRRVGGGVIGSGNETAFWQNDEAPAADELFA